MSTFTYRSGQELPGLDLPWEYQDTNGVWQPLDLSTGYTFTLALLDADDGIDSTPSATTTGYAGGVRIAWAEDDLALTAGTRHVLWVTAVESATSKERVYNPGNPPQIVIT